MVNGFKIHGPMPTITDVRYMVDPPSIIRVRLDHPPTLSDSFLHDITRRELVQLREAVIRIHLKECPDIEIGLCEADKMIAAVGPKTAENMLRLAVDKKIGNDDLRENVLKSNVVHLPKGMKKK